MNTQSHNAERPEIIKRENGSDFLVIVAGGGSVIGLGIRGFRASLKQIENSTRELSPSTAARADALRAGIALWEARA